MMIGSNNLLSIGLMMVVQCLVLSHLAIAQTSTRDSMQLFKAELFLNKRGDDLNSGLYEGMVKGRRRFGNTQKPHGLGIINYFTNDKFHRKNYTGHWKDGNRHGNGTTYFRDGSIYKGEYINGLEEGRGEISYPNGNVLTGQFEDGKIHGHAVLRYANGDQREGFFRENELDGQVIFTMDSGQTVIELWRNGERVEEENHVIELDVTTIPTVDLNGIESSSSNGKETEPLPPRDDIEENVEIKSEDESSVLLDKLRAAIRSGDKTVLFTIDKGKDIVGHQSRHPKFDRTSDDTLSAIKTLREETEKRNKNFLMSVFSRVNGGAHTRKRRHSNYLLNRNANVRYR